MTHFDLWILVIGFLLSTVHGANRPQCSSDGYGQPQLDSCTQLILKEIPTVGGSAINRLFSLKTSIRPEELTRTQWRHRIELPFLRENDGCKIAFLAVRFFNGSISYDTSTWDDIREEAQRLKRICGVYPSAPLGGNLVVGDHSRLALILYAPGSVYDDIVKRDLAAGTVIVADEDPEPESGAMIAGIVEASSLSCRGALLSSGSSTICGATEGPVSVS